MALSSTDFIIPGRGTVFVAPPHTLYPAKASIVVTDTATYTNWECLGHTSRDNTVQLTKDGGDTTTKGSWLTPNLVSTKADVTWGVSVSSIQVDYLTLKTAFPAGRVAAGGFIIPADPGSAEHAVYVLCIGAGSSTFGIYMPRVSLSIGDAPSIDTENFFEIQISGPALSATAAVGTTDMVIGDMIKFFGVTTITAPA